MAHFGEDWDESDYPLAYLITVRTYGTWLHGDDRFSVDARSEQNIYGTPKLMPNPGLEARMRANMSSPPVTLSKAQRTVVHTAIEEVCDHRRYGLHAVNVRSNHSHVVVSAQMKPEPIADAFKAYATRKLCEQGLCDGIARIWSRGRSRRYLWEENRVARAIDYVLFCQGDIQFEDWYSANFDD